MMLIKLLKTTIKLNKILNKNSKKILENFIDPKKITLNIDNIQRIIGKIILDIKIILDVHKPKYQVLFYYL